MTEHRNVDRRGAVDTRNDTPADPRAVPPAGPADDLAMDPYRAGPVPGPMPPYGYAFGYPAYGHPYGPGYDAPPDSLGAGGASAITFLAGVWLVIAPFALDYEATGSGLNGYWNDVTIGIVVALLALVRAVGPRDVPWFSVVNVVLGGWLLAAPWVLGYNQGTDSAPATINDMVLGAVVVIAAATSAAFTYRHRARIREEHDRREAERAIAR
ncbi:SPW repeat protein [Amycolatopsis tolypomycina]|uniref:SPW repeat protein n=1 Tax=Amycolatopsis tolypomycina TaxID=208445 RepID=UPI0033B82370